MAIFDHATIAKRLEGRKNCPVCDGTGGGEWEELDLDYGMLGRGRARSLLGCKHCGGSGLDPSDANMKGG